MGINQYFDENKIIKKKQIIEEEVKDEQIQNKEINKIEKKQKINLKENEQLVEIKNEITERKNDKVKKYVEAINNIEKEEVPVYNISRDENKNVVINPKKTKKKSNEKEESQKKSNKQLKNDIFQEQLLKIKEDNERKLQGIRIEIIIHNNLINREPNVNKKKLYESRLNSLMDELEFCNKRKSILEDNTIWPKE